MCSSDLDIFLRTVGKFSAAWYNIHNKKSVTGEDIMRRKDREITDIEKIKSILAGARYMHLGMFDGEYPYVVPMHYGFELQGGKLTFYVHCAGEGHKLDCLRKNASVFVEIDTNEKLVAAETPCGCGAEYGSVMGRGRAAIVEEPAEKCRALALLMKTQTGRDYAIDEGMAARVTVIRIDAESYTAKARA